MPEAVVVALISGATVLLTPLFTAIATYLAGKFGKTAMAQQAWQEDTTKKLEEAGDMIRRIRQTERSIMRDRLRCLCLAYLEAGQISSAALEDLSDMYQRYTEDLGGNGFVKGLFDRVRTLPIVD